MRYEIGSQSSLSALHRPWYFRYRDLITSHEFVGLFVDLFVRSLQSLWFLAKHKSDFHDI